MRHDAEGEPDGPSKASRDRRLVLGTIAAGSMVLSVLFEAIVFGLSTGAHTDVVRTEGYGAREALIALVGLGAAWFVYRPERPDVRVAQAAMMAAGVVAVAVGFTLFSGAFTVEPNSLVTDAWPGLQSWMLLVSGVLFVYLRFKRTLWPDSVWEHQILSAKSRRR